MPQQAERCGKCNDEALAAIDLHDDLSIIVYHAFMPRVVADVPAESSILCEGCGYTLDGLPPGSNCPECGKPMVESTSGDGRAAPRWETGGGAPIAEFWRITGEIIFRPSRFFRGLTTRGPLSRANRFAAIHWWIASALFATAGLKHWNWYASISAGGNTMTMIEWLLLIVATYVSLWGITSLATRLTTWEARYRGLRLPQAIVRRGLDYHAAHYLPVGLGAWGTTALYQRLLQAQILKVDSAYPYLSALSAEVILAAFYLFWTYWAAMRNMMYANR